MLFLTPLDGLGDVDSRFPVEIDDSGEIVTISYSNLELRRLWNATIYPYNCAQDPITEATVLSKMFHDRSYLQTFNVSY